MISVIVPVYNAEKYLDRCIDSILAQTFRDIEVLLIDDGSTDGSAAICDEYAEKDERVAVYHQENGGVSKARNIGVGYASGEYVAFVDADDLVSKYYLQEAYDAIIQTNADFVIGGTKTFDEIREVLPDVKPDNMVYAVYRDEQIRDLYCNLGCLRQTIRFNDSYINRGPVSRLIKKHIAVLTPFHEELRIGEDMIWNLEVLSQCQCVCIVKSRWYWYRSNQQSTMHRYDPEILSALNKYQKTVEKLLDLDNDKEYLIYVYGLIDGLYHIRRSVLEYTDTSNRNLHKKIKKTVYTEDPWIKIKDKRFFMICPIKYKLAVILYSLHVLYFFWKVRRIV